MAFRMTSFKESSTTTSPPGILAWRYKSHSSSGLTIRRANQTAPSRYGKGARIAAPSTHTGITWALRPKRPVAPIVNALITATEPRNAWPRRCISSLRYNSERSDSFKASSVSWRYLFHELSRGLPCSHFLRCRPIRTRSCRTIDRPTKNGSNSSASFKRSSQEELVDYGFGNSTLEDHIKPAPFSGRIHLKEQVVISYAR